MHARVALPAELLESQTGEVHGAHRAILRLIDRNKAGFLDNLSLSLGPSAPSDLFGTDNSASSQLVVETGTAEVISHTPGTGCARLRKCAHYVDLDAPPAAQCVSIKGAGWRLELVLRDGVLEIRTKAVTGLRDAHKVKIDAPPQLLEKVFVPRSSARRRVMLDDAAAGFPAALVAAAIFEVCAIGKLHVLTDGEPCVECATFAEPKIVNGKAIRAGLYLRLHRECTACICCNQRCPEATVVACLRACGRRLRGDCCALHGAQPASQDGYCAESAHIELCCEHRKSRRLRSSVPVFGARGKHVAALVLAARAWQARTRDRDGKPRRSEHDLEVAVQRVETKLEQLAPSEPSNADDDATILKLLQSPGVNVVTSRKRARFVENQQPLDIPNTEHLTQDYGHLWQVHKQMKRRPARKK